MLTVGLETRSSRASRKSTSWTQCVTPSCFLVVSSFMRCAEIGGAADESFDVDGWFGDEELEGFQEVNIVDPMRDAELFLGCLLIHAVRRFADHGFLGGAERAGVVGVSIDGGRVAVGGDERVERLDEMPGGAIDAGFVARVKIGFGTTAPALAARYEFEFDDAFRAEIDGDGSIEGLHAHGHVEAGALVHRGEG